MKLLVIQEQHFIKMPNGEVWVDQQSDRKFWERYLNVFDEIVVCGRFKKSKTQDTSGLVRSDRERVSFVELTNFRGVAGLAKKFVSIVTTIRKAIDICDCVIFRAPSPISLVSYPIVRLSGKPFACEIMNNPATHFSKEAMQHFYQPAITWFMVAQTKSLCRHANGVSYVTEHVLQEMYPCKSRMKGESEKYFEASYSTIRLDEKCYKFDEWSEKRPDTVVCIHTGKMEDNRKGQDIFIKTIALLSNKGYDIKGILVGDGELRPQFEELGRSLGIADKLEFVGWKAGFDAVQAELCKAHIAIFPSIGEGLPRSTIEAMASGLLCFGSKVDGLCELLDGKLLANENNETCFSNNISIYLDDWKLADKERKKLFERSKQYHHSILDKRRNEFYTKLLRCAKRKGTK
ncbi:glycosyltransferase [Acetivibrio cellulolyticus]|uniref:glycosyltransferase n=1 Tax=Acetivibrio cellulolyticus TaxID=35830 RepID=UPI0001E2CBE3|nr:glycosyltransferase [Acetivibrio cellulolyticus]